MGILEENEKWGGMGMKRGTCADSCSFEVGRESKSRRSVEEYALHCQWHWQGDYDHANDGEERGETT